MGCTYSDIYDPNDEGKCQRILSKFPVTSIAQLEESPFPQVICGRVAPTSHTTLIESVIDGKPCIYYQVSAFEVVTDTRSQYATKYP